MCVPGDETSEVCTPKKKKKDRKAKKDKKKNKKEKEGKIAKAQQAASSSSHKASKGGVGSLSEDELEVMKRALATVVSSSSNKQKKVSKKPAGIAAKDKNIGKIKQKKETKKKSKLASCQGKNGNSPAKFHQKKKKTSFLHRATSSAYHKARLRAKAQGFSIEAQKAAGRSASREVAQKIQNGVLKEEAMEEEGGES